MPKTYTEYTSRRVLTTQWIDGEKLSQSTADDVGDLVNVGVICYLKQVRFLRYVHTSISRSLHTRTNVLLVTLFQLLDTGFFHADPHPGNLIRTPEGKLAVLDFGSHLRTAQLLCRVSSRLGSC